LLKKVDHMSRWYAGGLPGSVDEEALGLVLKLRESFESLASSC
jgi:hypothetical protein